MLGSAAPISFDEANVRAVLDAARASSTDISSAYDSPAKTVDAWVDGHRPPDLADRGDAVTAFARRGTAHHGRPPAPRVLPAAPPVRPQAALTHRRSAAGWCSISGRSRPSASPTWPPCSRRAATRSGAGASYFRFRGRDWSNSTAAGEPSGARGPRRATAGARARRLPRRPRRRLGQPRAARGLRAADATRRSSPRSTTRRSGRSCASWSRARSAARASPRPCSTAAIDFARAHGATTLEAYPVDASDGRGRRRPTPTTARSRCSSGPGSRSSSGASGTPTTPVRPIVRLELATG